MSRAPRQDMPRPLSGRAKGLLVSYRRGHAVPAPVFVRGAERLLELERLEASRRTRRVIVGVAAVVAVAAVVILSLLAPSFFRSDAPPASHEQAPYDRGGKRPAPTTERLVELGAATQRTESASATAPPVPLPTPKTPVLAPASTSDGAPLREGTARPRRAAVSTLAEERRVLGAAWDALLQGSPARALEQAEEHRRRFPHGVLHSERGAIEAVADCRLGGSTPGRRAATYLERFPDALLADTVRKGCRQFLEGVPAP